jgi:hypothetical protein
MTIIFLICILIELLSIPNDPQVFYLEFES